MTKPSPRYAALLGIRNGLIGIGNAIDALIMQEEIDDGLEDTPADPEACPECGASSDDQKDVSTVDGTRRRHCLRCGLTFVLGQHRSLSQKEQ